MRKRELNKGLLIALIVVSIALLISLYFNFFWEDLSFSPKVSKKDNLIEKIINNKLELNDLTEKERVELQKKFEVTEKSYKDIIKRSEEVLALYTPQTLGERQSWQIKCWQCVVPRYEFCDWGWYGKHILWCWNPANSPIWDTPRKT